VSAGAELLDLTVGDRVASVVGWWCNGIRVGTVVEIVSNGLPCPIVVSWDDTSISYADRSALDLLPMDFGSAELAL